MTSSIAAEMRRGTPTINAIEGDDVALLAGDYVLGRAGEAGIRASQAIGLEMANTIVALCFGQTLETVRVFQPDRTREDSDKALEGKTAALLKACCAIGVLSSNPGDAATLAAFSAYGRAFGMAFQIVDDVLDLVSTDLKHGKRIGQDILLAGVLTLPLIIARDSGDTDIPPMVEAAWEPARRFDSLDPNKRLIELMNANSVHVDEELTMKIVDSLKRSPYVSFSAGRGGAAWERG